MGKFIKDVKKNGPSEDRKHHQKVTHHSKDPFASKKIKSKSPKQSSSQGHQKLKYRPNQKPNDANSSNKQANHQLAHHQETHGLLPKKGLSALQEKFAKKLQGSRFRAINEGIYTTSGSESFESFQNNPELFDIYHTGFREQASQWPENPLDSIISWVRKMDRNTVVADMGCGDARLAQSVQQKVHSFDLVSTNSWVTAADIAHVPLGAGSVDVVVFCLSLMGTNIGDFILEAHRILKVGGVMRIVEVRSRFEKEADGIKKFIRTVKKAGFSLQGNERDAAINTMFFLLECRKTDGHAARPDEVVYSAKPCVYKKR